MRRGDDHPGGRSVALLATAFVVIGGLVCCTFISVTFSTDPLRTIGYPAAFLFGGLLLGWLLRDRPAGSPARGLVALVRRKRPQRCAYQLRRKPSSPSMRAPQAPPTAEQIREIRDNANTWVPSNTPRRSR